jgi:hypothetical protein
VRKSAVRPVLLAVHIFTPWSEMSAFLKSFGRRRRTKVLDERTRGEQTVYGEFAW